MTLAELIAEQAQRLTDAGVAFGQGTLDAHDEAAWLALAALGLPIDGLDDHEAKRLDDIDETRVRALVEHRIHSRKPTAYLTGEAWLQGVPFTIDDRAIVPRSFIAELIAESTIDPWLSDQTRQVLDLCTGNGSLAVLAAMAWPEVHVDASDLSPEALALAQKNVQRHKLGERITLIESDAFAAVGDKRYDLILCNPPYVPDATIARLPAEFQAEPLMALAGGPDGMVFVRRLLADAAAHLADNGVLVLEIGHERETFERTFPRLEPVGLATSAGDDQVLLLTADKLSAWAKSASRSA